MRHLWLVLVCACTPVAAVDAGPGTDAARAPDVPIPIDVGPPGCAGSLDPIVCSGALDPTTLGAGIDVVRSGLAATSPGAHWFCRPGDGTAWNDRIVVYLVGTYGDPESEHALPAHACALGFVALAPMYNNRDMGRTVCEDDGACYEAFHAEIVDGTAGAPDPIDVDTASSIRNRLATLAEALASRGAPWTTVRDRLLAGDWSSIVIAGHSQGAGHAAYLAREESAERALFLAGPSDRIGEGTASPAPPPWIVALETAPLRTTLRFGVIHDDDSFANVPRIVDNWDWMGIADGTCAHTDEGGYLESCRRIRTAGDHCPGINAHVTPVAAQWGTACRAGVLHDNLATWEHLLFAEFGEAGRSAPFGAGD